jgi:hypothetical protein
MSTTAPLAATPRYRSSASEAMGSMATPAHPPGRLAHRYPAGLGRRLLGQR